MTKKVLKPTKSVKQQIFTLHFNLNQKLEYVFDRELEQAGVTAKQWLMLMTIATMFDAPPSMNDTAREMASSHQNIKQMAVLLEKKGYLKIQTDQKDRRTLRLVLTDNFRKFWKSRTAKDKKLVDDFFHYLTEKEAKELLALLTKVHDRTNEFFVTLKKKTKATA